VRVVLFGHPRVGVAELRGNDTHVIPHGVPFALAFNAF
jgi:hypothetical protein